MAPPTSLNHSDGKSVIAPGYADLTGRQEPRGTCAEPMFTRRHAGKGTTKTDVPADALSVECR